MRYLILLLLAVGFMGCAARVSMYREALPAKPVNSNIDVYRTAKPNRAYIELGEIKFNSHSDKVNIKKLKEAARKIGADGIIIIGATNQSGGAVPIGKVALIGTEEYGMKAVAIKYK